MGRKLHWRQDEIDLLGHLIKQGLTNHEIAPILGRGRDAIAIKSQRFFGGNPNFQARITKHKHLREQVMTYFLTHTMDECANRFSLTPREIRSIFTVGYRMPEFAHLRKDPRRHDAWNTEELLFLLRHAGLKPRDWIAQKLKRGGPLGIKDRLESLGISSRTLNGITLSQYRTAFQQEPGWLLETDAGPGRSGFPTHYKIIPWIQLEKEIRQKRIRPHRLFRKTVKTMCLFQRWVHGKRTWKSLKTAAGRGHAFRV